MKTKFSPRSITGALSLCYGLRVHAVHVSLQTQRFCVWLDRGDWSFSSFSRCTISNLALSSRHKTREIAEEKTPIDCGCTLHSWQSRWLALIAAQLICCDYSERNMRGSWFINWLNLSLIKICKACIITSKFDCFNGFLNDIINTGVRL